MQPTREHFPFWDPTVTASTSNAEYSDSRVTFPISKVFNAEQLLAPDVAFLSSDGVYFCIHLPTARRRCPGAFQPVLDTRLTLITGDLTNPVQLACPARELNIILHALYEMSMEPYQPEPDIVEAAVDFMPRFDITVNLLVYEECPIYKYIVSYTPLQPIHVYALAAHCGVHSLAVQASAYLLDLELHSLPDDLAERMGVQYLMKLIRLHATRSQALKEALLVGPLTHPAAEIDTCGFTQQQKAKRVWAFFCADPKWHSDPVDNTVNDMEEMLEPLLEDLTCTECKLVLRRVVARVRSHWVTVPALRDIDIMQR